jgi:hypothetical protein
MDIDKYTFERRLGMVVDEDAGCKQCGDSSTHKYPGWATRDHKVAIHPDQWESDSGWLKPLPDDIPEEDVCYTQNVKIKVE